MIKKNEKPRVGRPKLADDKTKKESIFVCLFVFIIISVVVIIGYNIIMLDFNPKYNVGSVYNKKASSCAVYHNKIECGQMITAVKYKIDNKSYKEVLKKEDNIIVNISGYKRISICYKIANEEYFCEK